VVPIKRHQTISSDETLSSDDEDFFDKNTDDDFGAEVIFQLQGLFHSLPLHCCFVSL